MKDTSGSLFDLLLEVGEESKRADDDVQYRCLSPLLACLEAHRVEGKEVDYAHAELASFPTCGDTNSLKYFVSSSHSPRESCQPSMAAAVRVCQTSRIPLVHTIQKEIAVVFNVTSDDPEPTPDSSGGDRDPVSILQWDSSICVVCSFQNRHLGSTADVHVIWA
jgi:hypothetical protein